MKTMHALSLLLCVTQLSAAEIKVGTRWPELLTIGGQRFWDVKFTFVSAREVRFMHTGGVGSMPLSEVVLAEDATVTASPPATSAGPLEALMTAEERKISGIDKLSPEEQAALARWMQQTASQVLKEALEKQWAQPSSFHLSATAPRPMGQPPVASGAEAPAPPGPPMVTVASLAGTSAEGAGPGASPQLTSPVPAKAVSVTPPLQPEAFPASSPALLPPPRPIVAPTAAPPVAPPVSAVPALESLPATPVVQAAR